VLDNRFDTSKICLSNHGYSVKFDRQAADCIADYIRNSTRPVAKGVRTPLLNIKKLHCSLEMNGGMAHTYMIFEADAFIKNKNGSYAKLVTLEVHSGYNEASAAATVGRILDFSIRWIDIARFKNGESYSLDCINSQINAEWAAYPILRNEVRPVPGYYTSFAKLRNDSITPYPIRMALRPDSSYQVIAPPGPDPKTGKTIGPLWAVADSNGILYIQLENNIFLPLYKGNSGFTFQMPRGLSDKHLFQLIELQNPPSGLGGMTNFGFGSPEIDNGAGALLFVGVIMVIGGTYEIIKDVSNKSLLKERDRQVKKYTASRDAVLSMDTGEITYY
jgi:hypothetical protein